jgi:hypothetical protein
VGLSHINLNEYYHLIFSLAQHHKYSISDMENLIPYERDIYIDMLMKLLDEQRKELEKRKK